ncbi:MAG TPA: hypothetical protein VFX97_12305 [Pyrinomonadaceae bacterium]|nr:hypothetical protein [Pyrinomonadaceae bacterium]
MKLSSFASVLVFALALVATSCQQSPSTQTSTPTPAATRAAGITAADIPAGYGYPGDRAQIQGWADQWEIAKITQHTWDMWAGMTADSGQTDPDGSKLPYWETWCGTADVFGGTCGKGVARPSRPFRVPSQFTHSAQLKGSSAPAPDTQVVSFNKFNPSMAQYLNAQHAGPGTGGPYNYTSVSSLIALNNAWPSGTATVDRKVEEAPYQPSTSSAPGFAGIETKPVIFLVKATGLTPMPLWQGPAGSTLPTAPTPNTWTTCVLLDPANTGGPDVAPVLATPQQIAQAVAMPYACDKTKYLYAPLSTIYSFKMNADEAASWNAVQKGVGGSGGTAAAGDYGVLGGMHVNSKEIINWTWQTFYWQPGPDTPNKFPGSKDGMTANVKGPWRNYASCSAYNQTQGNASTKMVVCFNPFLETATNAGIPDGLQSNCVSCHGTATVSGPPITNQNPPPSANPTTLPYPPDYKKPISFGQGGKPIDPRFAGFTRTDFSWAIPQNAQ